MRLSRVLTIALALLVVRAAPAAAWQQAPAIPAPGVAADQPEPKSPPDESVRRAPDRVVVSWKDPARAADGARGHGLQMLVSPPGAAAAVLRTGNRSVDAVLAELRADPAVAWAEPDYELTIADEGRIAAVNINDPLTAQQYALDRMHVREAWSIETGAVNVIAVLDTGAWAAHPDLAGRLVPGYDFVNSDSNTADDNAHGTWVSGIIAANANDGYGIAGISWSDKVMPVKVMDENGTGWTSHLAAGIRWAVDHGASVINMSIGGYADAQVLREAVEYAWAHDVVMVAAAGNFRSAGHVYPASFPQVISVSATQADDEFTNWSNYGADIDVSAPGGSVLTTNCNRSTVPSCAYTGSHIVISGTSFASPNVAGVVALVRARNPAWSNAAVVARIQATADDLGYGGWDNRYGHGRVNAARALGGTTVAPAASPGDALEANNAFASAKPVAIGSSFRPSIHPASDVDYFAFDLPRAGRLDLTVAPVIDSVRPPKSSLPVDPVLHIYDDEGTLLLHVDDPGDSQATERGSVQRIGPGRVVLRVNNWFPNGNRSAYTVTSAFVDNVAPAVVARNPSAGATSVPFDGSLTITFSETVGGVSASTILLRNSDGQLVPAVVTYDSTARRATLRPSSPLAGERVYRLTVSSSITDVVGNRLPGDSWQFETGKADRRLAGADRYATAAAVSAAGFAPGVPVAYVATGTNFPDALAAGPLAARTGGPILLATRDHLPAATAAELTRLRPAAIVVLGGAGAVSDAVAASLRGYATGGSLTRLAGADRYATAAAVSAAGFAPGVPVAYVATGTNFPDALAAGPLAARTGGPILLATRDHLPAATAAELTRLRPAAIVVLGGAGAVSDAVAASLRGYATGGSLTRLAGADRYATAAAVSGAGWQPDAPATVFLATGATFADALAASPLAGRMQVPLLLTDPGSLSVPTADALVRLDPADVLVLGSSGAVSDRVISEIRALWN